MTRQISGFSALLILLALTVSAEAQMPPLPGPAGVAQAGVMPYGPMPGGAWGSAPGAAGYPVQAALYAQPPGAASQIQLAGCSSCQTPSAVPMQGMPMQGMPMQGVPMQGMPPGGYEIPLDSAVDCYGDPCADPGMCGPGGACAGWFQRLCARLGACCSNVSCGSGLCWTHGPNGDGGCCLPRWYDIHAEWLYWTRDFDESLQLASQGILGPDALNVNDLDFDEQSGFRVTWAYPIAPAAALEVTYFGQLHWSATAAADGDMNLFSVFSDFGSDPLYGFPETDFAYRQTVSLSTELDNGELNWRHRWVSANCMLHSSWLIGARYLRLREDMVYSTATESGGMTYRLKTDNDLVGAQIGTDLFLCLTPRFKIGGEIEAGVYGTNSRQRTNVSCNEACIRQERDHENDAAFIGEAGVMALFRATPRLTLRAGYQALFIDGVALAADNFNTASPFSNRSTFVDNTGNLVMHGSSLGFEWTW